jgi:glycosyltransferase involved in cell wall biosynthesis
LNIDLILFSSKAAMDWPLGKLCIINHNFADIQPFVAESTSDFILFWDANNPLPSSDLLAEITSRPGDIWHAGLRFGLQGLPEKINFVHPTWMYNCDGNPSVNTTSFRLSFKAMIGKTSVLQQVEIYDQSYTSISYAGIDLGYRLIRSGAIIRYDTDLIVDPVRNSLKSNQVNLHDEWYFICKYFSNKWRKWTLLRSFAKEGALVKNLQMYTKFKSVPKHKFEFIHQEIRLESGALDKYKNNISVLAPTLNRYSYLEAEYQQLAKQSILPLEALTTDQTSLEQREEIKVDKYPPLRIRTFVQEEKGQCVAWNKLLEESKGEYVFFLGDDADDIHPDFIERMCSTMEKHKVDMVATNVIEAGNCNTIDTDYTCIAETFPITLIKKKVVMDAGAMDMLFNKGIRADGDLAMRCYLNGATFLFDSSLRIFHHRAPVGGLRSLKQRVITNHMTKTQIMKFTSPTATEKIIMSRYFSKSQIKEEMLMRKMSALSINGPVWRKIVKLFVGCGWLLLNGRKYKV